MKKNILIAGGGIAGLTAARFLSLQGHEVTVIDRVSSYTKTGFLISLKSFGVKIMDGLALTDRLRAASSPSESVSFMERNDEVIQKISYEEMNKNIERSILISRGGLHHVLYEDIIDEVNILFGTTISSLIQKGNNTVVALSDGTEMEVDLVIISEGLRSPTRDRYFENSKLEDFNTLYLGGKLQLEHSYEIGSFKIYIDVNKMLSIYPIADNEIAIQCYIRHTGDLSTIRDHIPNLLKDSFTEYSIEVRELLDHFSDNRTMFIDKMGMITARDLVNGNLVLLGDTGYCPTALSGMGASLSIYGAKALAQFIGENPNDLCLALKNYNTLMQPIIGKFQGNARNNASSFIPASKEKLDNFVTAFSEASEMDLQHIMTDPIVLTEDQMNFKIG
ncbi:FAD-dependent monooxygenase [Chryseobacterium fluminis]|uniref:FAD-dependent monooxygenase n=1 Tax=Chryseobacterium fluminis TaxID=2983606 RepID=UPI00225BD12E|nr:FAD-dependent monooxygenase [Chryseobacterium sp. MMS21-Ot14]UZT99043.1 FAD-dependent monooxygenase [Chryseobacterium sp. MMS21-Ot14]